MIYAGLGGVTVVWGAFWGLVFYGSSWSERSPVFWCGILSAVGLLLTGLAFRTECAEASAAPVPAPAREMFHGVYRLDNPQPSCLPARPPHCRFR